MEINSCALCWRLRYLWTWEKRESELEKHQNNWIAFCPDAAGDLEDRESGKNAYFLLNWWVIHPLSPPARLYQRKAKWISTIYWHGGIDNRKYENFCLTKDIWGIYHEYINVIDVWLGLLPSSYKCVWLQVCFSSALLLLSQSSILRLPFGHACILVMSH